MAKTQLQVAMFPSTVAIIRQVFVKKTYTARNIGMYLAVRSISFYFLPLPVNCSNLLFGEYFSYVCDAKLLIPYFSL